MTTPFDEAAHTRLLEALVPMGFAAMYRELCIRHGEDDGDPLPDAGRVHELFIQAGVPAKLHRRCKLIEFDGEEIGGWRWLGKLHIQRSGLLEPMVEARRAGDAAVIGSTWLDLAIDCGARSTPVLPAAAFLPPQLSCNRPLGRDPARLVPDLIALFRRIKDAVRPVWQ